MRSEKNLPLGDEFEDDEHAPRSRSSRGQRERSGGFTKLFGRRGGGKRSKRSGKTYASRLADPSYVRQIGSKAPQAIVSVCSHVHGSGVKNLLKYVGRVGKEKEIELEDQYGKIHTGQGEVGDIYESWAKFFDENKSYHNSEGEIVQSRHATHIVLSADCEPTDKNVNLVAQAARETAYTYFRTKGYDYVIGLHQDSKCPHAHLVVRCNPRDKGKVKKLRLNPNELLKLRRVFAERLNEQGLEHKATLRRDEPRNIHDFLVGKSKRLKSKKVNWYKHALHSVREQVGLLEMRDRQFREAHKRAVSTKQKYDYLQKVKEALEVVRTDIREKTVFKSQERYDSMSLVRSFERKLEKRYFDKSKVRKGFLDLMKGMNAHLQIYDVSSSSDDKLKAINSFFGKQKKRSPAEIKRDELEKIFESIEAAKKMIRKHKDMSRPERKELRKILADFEKKVVKMGKAVGVRSPGRWV